MFQQTFVSEVHSGRKPIAVALSLTTQGVVLALLALAPLLVSHQMPTAQLRSLLLSPAAPVMPDKPIPEARTTGQTNVPLVRSFRLTAPVVIPKLINTSAPGALEAPNIAEVNGSDPGKQSLLSGLSAWPSIVAPPRPKLQPEIKQQVGPLVIGGKVAAASLVYRVEPGYPPLAKAARIQGVVVFQAVIGVDGQIRGLQLQEGHPLLVAAAKNAILQWRYRPTLLNGKPVEVVTTITVRFALSQ